MAEHHISVSNAENDILACATYLAENITSRDGHAEAIREAVARYIEAGNVDLAAELADTVDDPFVRDRLLAQVAEKCAALDDDEYAMQLVDAIEEENFRSVAKESIAVRKASLGEFDLAFEIAEGLEHSSDAFAAIAVHQAEKVGESAAFDTISRIEFPLSVVHTFQALAAGALKAGEPQRAAELIEMACAATDEIEFAEEHIRALIDDAVFFTEAKRPDRAIETLSDAQKSADELDSGHREAFLSAIALAFHRAGSIELADRALDLIGDNTQIAATLVGFSGLYREGGNPDEALETLEEAYAILRSQSDRDIRDSRARFTLLGTAGVRFAQFGKPDRGIEIAQEIPDESSQVSALSRIAEVCCLEGNDELARQALNAITDDSQKLSGLIVAADAKIEIGQTADAITFLNEAHALSETVPQLTVRSALGGALAERFHRNGHSSEARSTLLETLRLITGIKDAGNRAAALMELSDVYRRLQIELNDEEKGILRSLTSRAS
jgi:tetratricopeptide (TPR) repeat protein